VESRDSELNSEEGRYSALNCYVHPEVPAVGVCASCGRGVCEACAVKLGGKLYCKIDVEASHYSGGRVESVKEWHPTIGAAAYFFSAFAIVAALVGVLLVAFGAELGTQQSGVSGFPLVSQMASAASVVGILVGVFFIFLAALDVITIYWLDHSNLNGGKLGMTLSVGWTISFVGFSAIPGGEAFGVVGVIVNLFVIFLLVTGWKELT